MLVPSSKAAATTSCISDPKNPEIVVEDGCDKDTPDTVVTSFKTEMDTYGDCTLRHIAFIRDVPALTPAKRSDSRLTRHVVSVSPPSGLHCAFEISLVI